MNSLVQFRSKPAAPAHHQRPVKELVILSGKGGTGKTSLAASFAALATNAVLADCDVDAADLQLLVTPRILRREPFTGGDTANIDPSLCTGCGLCEDLCRFDAIYTNGPGDLAWAALRHIDPLACEGCSVCAWFCPTHAIQMNPVINGESFVSETRFGPMVHARLGAAQDNSGKLVSLVRTTARKLASEHRRELVLIDGSPGVGCPVIASVTGATQALIVTEPTPSGLHDLERVAELTAHFHVPTALCINKWDLNSSMSDLIESRALDRGTSLTGRVRYDRAATQAQIAVQSIVEYAHLGTADGIAADIRRVWQAITLLPALAAGNPQPQSHPPQCPSESSSHHQTDTPAARQHLPQRSASTAPLDSPEHLNPMVR